MDELDDVATVANRVTPVWEQVLEDTAATAEAYREDGWTAIECHPGDITVVGTADVEHEAARTGIDVIVPDDEFDRVSAAVDDDGAFDEVEMFRAEQEGVLFVVAAVENQVTETAILVPLYYDTGTADGFLSMVESEGVVRLHVRPLDERRVVTFTQGDPTPFLPDGA